MQTEQLPDLRPNGTKPNESEFTISVSMDGFPVAIKFTGDAKRLRAVIDALKASGATPPPVRTFGGGNFQRKDTRVDPAFNDAGKEICPVHRKLLQTRTTQDGRSFKSCSSKATGAEGEKINDRGYCALSFK